MIRSLYIGLLKKSIYVNQKLLVLPPNSLHKLCYCSGDIKNSTYDDPQRRKKKLELEICYMKQNGAILPSHFTDEDWAFVQTLETKKQRKKFYKFLYGKEMKKKMDENNKADRRLEAEERRNNVITERANNKHIIYGLGHTSLLPKLHRTSYNKWYHSRVALAMQYGQKLIFDCSYEQEMTRQESMNAAKQLSYCIGTNRKHSQPFDIHICNLNWESRTMQMLIKYVPNINTAAYPINCHPENLLDAFSAEKLVYLTPHCTKELESFNYDDIYVIAGMVDKGPSTQLSLAKAKEMGIRMAKLPLDRFYPWKSGPGKSLTLDQMIKIMLDLQLTNDWIYSLRHVPQRKTNRKLITSIE